VAPFFLDTVYMLIRSSANRITGLVRRNFKNIDFPGFLLLYKSMIRSHLEYAQTVWSPHKVKLIEALEKVQKRATKILPGLRHLSYSQRLQKLHLPTLVYRRARGDMIEVFKILHGYYDPDPALPETKFIHTHKRQWQKAFQVVLPIGCQEILFYCSCCVKLEFVAQWRGECNEHQCIQESIGQVLEVSRSHLQLQGWLYIITSSATLKNYWKIWIHGPYGLRPVPVCVCV